MGHIILLAAFACCAALFLVGAYDRPAYAQPTISLDRSEYPTPPGKFSDYVITDPLGERPAEPDGRPIYTIHPTAIVGTLDHAETLPHDGLMIYIKVSDPNFTGSAILEPDIEREDGTTHGPIKIMVVRGSETLLITTAGGEETSSRKLTTGADVQHYTSEHGRLNPVSGEPGMFEMAFLIKSYHGPSHPDCPALVQERADDFQDVDAHHCILSDDKLVVEYTDPSDLSSTVSAEATFRLHDAVLETDQDVYIIGSKMRLTLTEPDFNLDSDVRESYDLDIIKWNSGAAELTMGERGGELDKFDPESWKMLETGDSSGVFQAVINVPSELEEELLGRGEAIELEYIDWSLGGASQVGAESENISKTVHTSAFGATIDLDREAYSWVDKVLIEINAPNFNLDADQKDRIGSQENPIRITAGSDSIDTYQLTETGPDTGVFAGSIELIGFPHDADGNSSTGDSSGYDVFGDSTPQATGPDDGKLQTKNASMITVNFKFSGDEDPVTSSASIKDWVLGDIMWLDPRYETSGTGMLRVTDPDMNWNLESPNQFTITVVSDSDTVGTTVDVLETNATSGIFEGSVAFGTGPTSGGTLQVAERNTVTATYEDHTVVGTVSKNATATTIVASTSDPTPEPEAITVELDKNRYSWVDTVNITVTSAAHNIDDGVAEEIGNTPEAPVNISTNDGKTLDKYILKETGPDTGVFKGKVTLDGYPYNADGDLGTGESGDEKSPTAASGNGPDGGILPAQGTDSITVSFEPAGEEAVTDSADISWNEATVVWSESSYSVTDDATIRVTDSDMNLELGMVDTIMVNVTSGADPGGMLLPLDETGDSTGVFSANITLAADSQDDTLMVAENGTITAVYFDHTLPSPASPGDSLAINATADVVAVVQEEEEVEETDTTVSNQLGDLILSLDKETYTWTDVIHINITAPAYNEVSRGIDTLGSRENPLKIQVGNSTSLDRYTLTESGLNTGVFLGSVTLTGFRHDADGSSDTGSSSGFDANGAKSDFDYGGPDGELPARPGDTITVSFNATEGYIKVDANVGWSKGKIEWLSSGYSQSGTGKIRITDPDMNWNSGIADKFTINVTSGQNSDGVAFTVTETGDSTGIFEGDVGFTSDAGLAGRLHVEGGGRATAVYADHTPPDPGDTIEAVLVSAAVQIDQPRSSGSNNDSPTQNTDTPTANQDTPTTNTDVPTANQDDGPADTPQRDDEQSNADEQPQTGSDQQDKADPEPGGSNTRDAAVDPEPTCGEGTELVNDVCQAIGVGDQSTFDIVEWLIELFG